MHYKNMQKDIFKLVTYSTSLSCMYYLVMQVPGYDWNVHKS